MADTVTSQTIQDGQRKAVLKFTNASDGTGESAVKKVDVSALSTNAAGESCTTNVLAIGLSEDSNGYHDYSDFSGIPNNAGSGKTGDLDFTTVGHSSGDTYMIILELIKAYG